MDEHAIILEVQRGNIEAYGKLVDLHVRRVRAFIALNVPVPHLIDEIAHEAFVFAYHHIHEFEAGTSFFAYLKAVAANLIRTEVQRFSREQANRKKYLECRLVGHAQERIERADPKELDHLERCLERVPANLRKLVDLRYKLSLSAEETAKRLQQSVAWVRTTLYRVRKELKQCVEAKLAVERR